jgi:hypothetical protein
MSVAWFGSKTGPSDPSTKGTSDGHTQHTHSLAHLEEVLTVLFCLIDDAYRLLNPHGARRYEAIKRLSDSEIITLALLQQLRGSSPNAPFCGMPSGSSLTWSPGWWGFTLPRSIEG